MEMALVIIAGVIFYLHSVHILKEFISLLRLWCPSYKRNLISKKENPLYTFYWTNWTSSLAITY